jgi:hypothetical protein
VKAGTLSEAVLFRLYLARLALEDGTRRATDPMPFERMRSVLALDDAAELALLTLLSIINQRPKRDAALAEHLVPLVASNPSLARHSGPLERLRRLRDRVKHDGVIPSAEDARLAASDVDGFMREVLLAVVGRPLEEITPIEALEDAIAKKHLHAATKAIEAGDYENAVIEAAIAFNLGTHHFFERMSPFYRYHVDDSSRAVGRLLDVIGRAAESAASGLGMGAMSTALHKYGQHFRSVLTREASPLRDLLEPLARPARFARFGIDPADLRRFEDVTPHVLVFSDEKAQVSLTRELHSTKEEAIFALDLATRSLLRLEDWLRRNPKHLK